MRNIEVFEAGKNHFLLQKVNLPASDNYFTLQSINKYATEGEMLPKRFTYPPIPILCQCGCKEVVRGRNEYIHGHSLKGKHHTNKTKRKISKSLQGHTSSIKGIPCPDERREKISIAKRKKFIPKIPTLCKCGCNEIVWYGHEYIYGHGYQFKKGQISPMKGSVLPEEQRKRLSNLRKGKHPWNKGKKNVYSEDTLKKLSKIHKGKAPWNKGKKGLQVHSEEVRNRISVTNKINGHRPPILTGEKSPRWKGGTSYLPYCPKFNEKLKAKIRQRDNYTCQLCGVKENGRRLSVHHIHYDKPNCDPDLIVLCCSCNFKVNDNRYYWEVFFMQKLKERGL